MEFVKIKVFSSQNILPRHMSINYEFCEIKKIYIFEEQRAADMNRFQELLIAYNGGRRSQSVFYQLYQKTKWSIGRDFYTPNNNENHCKACMRKYFKLRKNRKRCLPFFHRSCNIVPDTIDTINYLSQSECFLSNSFVKPKFENVLPIDFNLVIKKMMT